MLTISHILYLHIL